MKSKKLISVELSEELLNAVKLQAEKDDLTVSSIIRLALKMYLSSQRNDIYTSKT